jgi:hypothetical protein
MLGLGIKKQPAELTASSNAVITASPVPMFVLVKSYSLRWPGWVSEKE